MKTYKVFEKYEMDEILKKGNAEVTDFYEYLWDGFCNYVAIHWWVEKITDEQIAEEEADPDSVFCWLLKGRKIINDYLLSIGCEEDEMVYVDITW